MKLWFKFQVSQNIFWCISQFFKSLIISIIKYDRSSFIVFFGDWMFFLFILIFNLPPALCVSRTETLTFSQILLFFVASIHFPSSLSIFFCIFEYIYATIDNKMQIFSVWFGILFRCNTTFIIFFKLIFFAQSGKASTSG